MAETVSFVLQVLGFCVLVFGTSMYNELLRGCLPGVQTRRPSEDEEAMLEASTAIAQAQHISMNCINRQHRPNPVQVCVNSVRWKCWACCLSPCLRLCMAHTHCANLNCREADNRNSSSCYDLPTYDCSLLCLLLLYDRIWLLTHETARQASCSKHRSDMQSLTDWYCVMC